MAPPTRADGQELTDAAREFDSHEERRRSLRVPLHWTLYVSWHGDTDSHQTETKDLSKDGFYCTLDVPLTPGEYVDCAILVPTHASESMEVLSLRCRALVIRVEKIGDEEKYGLACRIEEYRLVRSPVQGQIRDPCTQGS